MCCRAIKTKLVVVAEIAYQCLFQCSLTTHVITAVKYNRETCDSLLRSKIVKKFLFFTTHNHPLHFTADCGKWTCPKTLVTYSS